jgi:hypothetical protein
VRGVTYNTNMLMLYSEIIAVCCAIKYKLRTELIKVNDTDSCGKHCVLDRYLQRWPGVYTMLQKASLLFSFFNKLII